jgi:hypothetical protein
LALALAACGGSAPPAGTGAREVANALRLARADFDRHRYDQAADGYGRALDLAWRLDDPDRLATIASERALALLRAGDAEAALAAARALRADLARRPATAPPLLGLVEAAAALRTGRLQAAEDALDRLRAEADPDPLVAGRIRYLRGRLAAARGDAAALRAVIAGWPPAASASLAADRRELEARLDLLAGRYGAALDGLTALAAERRALDQLPEVGETLALAGEAAAGLGTPARAADLHLRAARNALALDRPDLARARLARARAAAARSDDAVLEGAIDEVAARVEGAG